MFKLSYFLKTDEMIKEIEKRGRIAFVSIFIPLVILTFRFEIKLKSTEATEHLILFFLVIAISIAYIVSHFIKRDILKKYLTKRINSNERFDCLVKIAKELPEFHKTIQKRGEQFLHLEEYWPCGDNYRHWKFETILVNESSSKRENLRNMKEAFEKEPIHILTSKEVFLPKSFTEEERSEILKLVRKKVLSLSLEEIVKSYRFNESNFVSEILEETLFCLEKRKKEQLILIWERKKMNEKEKRRFTHLKSHLKNSTQQAFKESLYNLEKI